MKDQRNASHQLTFDFAEIDMSMYTHITNAIVSEFGLEMAGPKIDSFDLVSQDFCQGKDIVGLEWDTWSGYTVVAKSKSAEALTREIALYISTHFDP